MGSEASAWDEFGADVFLGYEYRLCIKRADTGPGDGLAAAFQRAVSTFARWAMSRRQTASGTGDRQGRSTSRPGTASVGSGQVYPHPSPHKREARGMPNVAGLVGEPTLAAATPHELRATYEGLLGL